MDEEEKKPDDANGLGEDLREALFEALTPEDLALIDKARAARERQGKPSPEEPQP